MRRLISLLAVLCCFILISGSAEGVGLKYYGVEDTINEDLSVTNQIVLKFDSPIAHLDYMLDFKIYNFKYEANFEFADCAVTDINGKSKISCDFIGMSREKNTLKLKFDTRNVIKRIGNNYKFTVNYGISLPIERVFVLIKLPQNGILSGKNVSESYFPSTGNILTDGKRIMVYWEEENLKSGDDLQFSVLYTMPMLPGPMYNFIIAVLTLVVVIAMILIAVYMKRPPENRETVREIVTSVLNSEEKTIVDILMKHEGKANQKCLVRESGFSKAKVSRIVKNLKSRGVVDVEPISGRENRVILRIERS